MSFKMIRQDITKVHADAIVNTANPKPVVWDGVDHAIYEAAGKEKLLAQRESIGTIAVGDVVATPAFELKAKYIFHAVGPWWEGGNNGEKEKLKSCYDKSLLLAKELGCKSIAFPFLSTGTYGVPRKESFKIALEAFNNFIYDYDYDYDLNIYFVVYDKQSLSVISKMFSNILEYVDDNYVRSSFADEYSKKIPSTLETQMVNTNSINNNTQFSQKNINDFINSNNNFSFHSYLTDLLYKKNIQNSLVYKQANLTKQYFSKLISGTVTPSKIKLLQLAVGLKLNIVETTDLLVAAGYS